MADVQYAKQQVDEAVTAVEDLQYQLQNAETQVEEARENLDTELESAKSEVEAAAEDNAEARKSELENMAS